MLCAQIQQMDLKSLTPQLAGVLRDMGVSYDPHRLADALKGKQLDVTARGAQVLLPEATAFTPMLITGAWSSAHSLRYARLGGSHHQAMLTGAAGRLAGLRTATVCSDA